MNKEEMYEKLKKIDPVIAEKLHPNDGRKIFRYLSLYEETHIPPSQVIVVVAVIAVVVAVVVIFVV